MRDAMAAGEAVPSRWADLPVGEIVRRLRLRYCMRQYQLAERADVPASLVCRVESGSDLRLSTLRRLFAAAHSSIVFLPRGGLAAIDEQTERLRRGWLETPAGKLLGCYEDRVGKSLDDLTGDLERKAARDSHKRENHPPENG